MKLLAIVPARGGSRGIPRKNLVPVAGRPLIAWTIAAGREAARVNRLIVSTDDPEIAEVSRRWGAEVPFFRPAELARDDTPTLPVIQHAVEWLRREDGYVPDAVVTLQPTSPLRRTEHIDEAIALFEADTRADSLVSCIPVPHIFHPRSVMRRNSAGYLEPYLSGSLPTQRQEKESVFARNGAAIYITRLARLNEFVFGGNLIPYFMNPEESVDIDAEEDLRRAEALLSGRI